MPIARASGVVRSGAAVVTARSALRVVGDSRAAIRLRVVACMSSVRPGCAGTTRTTLRAPMAKDASFGAWLTRFLRFEKKWSARGPASRSSVSPLLGSSRRRVIFATVRCQPPGPYATSTGPDRAVSALTFAPTRSCGARCERSTFSGTATGLRERAVSAWMKTVSAAARSSSRPFRPGTTSGSEPRSTSDGSTLASSTPCANRPM